jgi:hypothetical protein
MATDTRYDMVDSDDVIGTTVYDADDENVGKIERLMLTKRGGRVACAVLSFGGLWGLGSEYYPIPWSSLSYDEDLDGFRISITREQIENGPKFDPSQEYDWSDDNNRQIHNYYGARYPE